MASITIKEVASAAGVSFSTAAAALRGDGWVKASTRERVRLAAEQLGYTRSTYAAMLSSTATAQERRINPAVGWLTAFDQPGETVASMAGRLRQARAEAVRRGWFFHQADVKSEAELVRVAREWRAIGVDAVVLGFTRPLNRPMLFPWEEFVTISTETIRLEEGFDVVRPAHFRSVLELLREMRGRGYRRIGIWLREHKERVIDDDVRLGACTAFQSHDQKASERIPMLRTDFAASLDPLERWLRRHRPEAVMASLGSDIRLIEQAGLQVPRDLGFAALHVGNAATRITGVMERSLLAPDAAFEFLEQKLRSGVRGLSSAPKEVIYHTPIVEGRTLPRFGDALFSE